MKVKLELKGKKQFHYIHCDLKHDEIIDLLNDYSIYCAHSNKLITLQTIDNVVYLDKI